MKSQILLATSFAEILGKEVPEKMATRSILGYSEHDRVVSASAATYGEWVKKGYEISVNPGGEKNQSVGPMYNPLYPDVVVWMPDSIGSSNGKASVIEEIETADSINDVEAEQWKDYGSLGVKFLLVVPNGYCEEALHLINKYGANVSELWYYFYERDNIKFAKHNG